MVAAFTAAGYTCVRRDAAASTKRWINVADIFADTAIGDIIDCGTTEIIFEITWSRNG